MKSQKEQHCIRIDPGLEANVRRTKRRTDGVYTAFSQISTTHPKSEPDIFDLLEQVSKGAFSLFNELKRRVDRSNNVAYYPTIEWEKSKREVFSRHLKELRQIDLIRVMQGEFTLANGQTTRFPKQSYMINPHILKVIDTYQEAYILWEQAKK